MNNPDTNPYINNLELNQLSDYSFYKSTHDYLFRDSGLLIWVGIRVDPKTLIILDCKWHSTSKIDFKDELTEISNQIIGINYENLFKKINFKSETLKKIFMSLSDN